MNVYPCYFHYNMLHYSNNCISIYTMTILRSNISIVTSNTHTFQNSMFMKSRNNQSIQFNQSIKLVKKNFDTYVRVKSLLFDISFIVYNLCILLLTSYLEPPSGLMCQLQAELNVCQM